MAVVSAAPVYRWMWVGHLWVRAVCLAEDCLWVRVACLWEWVACLLERVPRVLGACYCQVVVWKVAVVSAAPVRWVDCLSESEDCPWVRVACLWEWVACLWVSVACLLEWVVSLPEVVWEEQNLVEVVWLVQSLLSWFRWVVDLVGSAVFLAEACLWVWEACLWVSVVSHPSEEGGLRVWEVCLSEVLVVFRSAPWVVVVVVVWHCLLEVVVVVEVLA